MDVGQIVESTSGGKVGSALITIILAGFLWVGKTTFEHVGQIAGILHQLDSAEASDASLRGQYDDIVRMLNERTKSRFTQEDADKLVAQIKAVEATHVTLKDQFVRDHAELRIEIANVALKPGAAPTAAVAPAYHNANVATQRIQQLEGQIAGLQSELTRLRHNVSLLRSSQSPAFETPSTLVAQPSPDQIPVARR